MTDEQPDIGTKDYRLTTQVFVASSCGFAAREAFASLNEILSDKMRLVVTSQLGERNIFLVAFVDGNCVRVKGSTADAGVRKWHRHFRSNGACWRHWPSVRIFGAWLLWQRKKIGRGGGRPARWRPLLFAKDHGLEFGYLDGLGVNLLESLSE